MAQQKVVLKILAMDDEKKKRKAIEAAADIYGIDSIAVDLKEQKMTIVGNMDTVAIAKKLKKIGKVDILSVGPAKEEKKQEGEKKQEKKEEKKQERRNKILPHIAASIRGFSPNKLRNCFLSAL